MAIYVMIYLCQVIIMLRHIYIKNFILFKYGNEKTMIIYVMDILWLFDVKTKLCQDTFMTRPTKIFIVFFFLEKLFFLEILINNHFCKIFYTIA